MLFCSGRNRYRWWLARRQGTATISDKKLLLASSRSRPTSRPSLPPAWQEEEKGESRARERARVNRGQTPKRTGITHRDVTLPYRHRTRAVSMIPFPLSSLASSSSSSSISCLDRGKFEVPPSLIRGGDEGVKRSNERVERKDSNEWAWRD